MSFLRDIWNNVDHPSDKWDQYFDIYSRHISVTNLVTLVEVGVQKGGSLEMWAKYFDGACKNIIGIDIDPECAKLKYDDHKINVVIGNQGDPSFWDEFLEKCGPIDIFIDDGGHFCDAQILTFEKVFPKLSVGGVYFCEDTHTSYMPYNGGGLKKRSNFIEYAKDYVDILHNSWYTNTDPELERKKKISFDLTSVHFYDSMVVFEKSGKKEMQRVVPGKFNRN